MELKDFTTDELRAEIKRRNALEKEKKEEEKRNALVCRNCKHCVVNPRWNMIYQCAVRTYGKTCPKHYVVKLSKKACDKFERKED